MWNELKHIFKVKSDAIASGSLHEYIITFYLILGIKNESAKASSSDISVTVQSQLISSTHFMTLRAFVLLVLSVRDSHSRNITVAHQINCVRFHHLYQLFISFGHMFFVCLGFVGSRVLLFNYTYIKTCVGM